MHKLIDSEKLEGWCKERLMMAFPPDQAQYADGRKTILELLAGELESGTFAPTPVQPDTINPGDKVKHRKMKHLGIGNVLEIAKSGERAYVDWPNYDKSKVNWAPTPAYYRLDKLEVIPNGY